MEKIRDAISRVRTDRPSEQPSPSRGRVVGGAMVDDFAAVKCDRSKFRNHRIISNEQDPVLNAYRVLRTRVMQKMEAERWKTLAVVSPGAGAGKTVTAINLAIALGTKSQTRPVLIDLDFYRPSVSRYLGLEDAPSVLDFFEDTASLKDVTVRPDIPGMLLAPNERVTRRGAEYLSSEKTNELINTAVNDYRSNIVIFDMSPILGCDDTIAFLPKVDCVLLVAASGQTRVSELKEAKRNLRNANIIGTVLNKSPSMLLPNQYY